MHFLTEILALSNFFGFQAVNWAPKWTKTVNFGAFHLSENLELSRIFQTLCLSYWKITSKIKQYWIEQYLEEQGLEPLPLQ